MSYLQANLLLGLAKLEEQCFVHDQAHDWLALIIEQ